MQHANYYQGLISILHPCACGTYVSILDAVMQGMFGTSSPHLCLSQAAWVIHPCV